MQLFPKLAVAVLAGVVLAGCYTGEMPLEKRFIRDYNIRATDVDGKTSLRITGLCGLPMGVNSSERRIQDGILYLTLVISEENRKDRQIDEQFVVPSTVNTVMLGDEVIWKRAEPRPRPVDAGWDK